MSILVKDCRIDPNDGPSMERWTVCPGHRLVRQQLTQGSFGLLPLDLNLKILCFNPKSSEFSHCKPRNITKTYLSQIINYKHRKLEPRKEKKVKNPSQECRKVPAL